MPTDNQINHSRDRCAATTETGMSTNDPKATNSWTPNSNLQAFWQSINDFTHEYIEGYEFRGDTGDYHPSDRERFLITDCAAGLLHDLGEAQFLAMPPASGNENDGTKVWRDLTIGETRQPGDRFMSEEGEWVTMTEDHLSLTPVVTQCSRPSQRRVTVINTRATL